MENQQLLHALSDMMDQKLEPICSRLDGMDARLDKLESQVSALRVGQLEMKKEMKEINFRVSQTHQLALDAWGTGIENRKWLENTKKSG